MWARVVCLFFPPVLLMFLSILSVNCFLRDSPECRHTDAQDAIGGRSSLFGTDLAPLPSQVCPLPFFFFICKELFGGLLAFTCTIVSLVGLLVVSIYLFVFAIWSSPQARCQSHCSQCGRDSQARWRAREIDATSA